MKFLVAKTRRVGVDVARVDLQWEQIGQYKFLDLYRDEVTVLALPEELHGIRPEVIYVHRSFDQKSRRQQDEWWHAFAAREINLKRV
jgi:hypothetical protein